MNDPLLSDFFLIGGSALSLQLGHRISIDLDFFNLNDFNENDLLTQLDEKYGLRMDYLAKIHLKGRSAV